VRDLTYRYEVSEQIMVVTVRLIAQKHAGNRDLEIVLASGAAGKQGETLSSFIHKS
jgi:hypothetical protein